MKTKFLALCALMMAVQSCTVVQSKTDPKTGDKVVNGYMLGVDADALVLDGPPPTVLGFQPITNKKGQVIGSRPVYGVAPEAAGQRALFTAYGMNHSKAFGRAANVVTTTALGMVAAGVQKSKDAATAANEAKAIDAKAATDKAALSNEAARDAQKHAESMAEIELAAPVAPAP